MITDVLLLYNPGAGGTLLGVGVRGLVAAVTGDGSLTESRNTPTSEKKNVRIITIPSQLSTSAIYQLKILKNIFKSSQKKRKKKEDNPRNIVERRSYQNQHFERPILISANTVAN